MTNEQVNAAAKTERPLPKDIQERYDQWKTLWRRSALYHYVFGVLGGVSSAVGASLVEQQADVSRVLSLIAVACFAIIGFVRPERRYLKFVRAWRVLDRAVRRYKRHRLDEAALDDAVDEGEDIITEIERETSWPKSRDPNNAEQSDARERPTTPKLDA